MESSIDAILRREGIPFVREWETDELVTGSGRHLRFDFAVLDEDGEVDFLIEAQGRQHYEPVPRFGGYRGLVRQQYNDGRKRSWCMDKGIPLVEVPYTDADRITYDYIMRAAGY